MISLHFIIIIIILYVCVCLWCWKFAYFQLQVSCNRWKSRDIHFPANYSCGKIKRKKNAPLICYRFVYTQPMLTQEVDIIY